MSSALQIILTLVGLLIPIGIAVFEHRRRSHHEESSVQKSTTGGSLVQVVKQRGRIVVGCTKHNDYFCNYLISDDTVRAVGLYPELAREFAREQKLEIEFKAIRWSEIEHAFSRHGCDLVLHVLETKARGAVGDFTFRRYRMSIAGVVRAGNESRFTREDLRSEDISIALVRGEAGWEYVSDDLEIRDDRRRPLDVADIGKMIDMVVAGTADLGVCDSVSIADYCAANPSAKLVWADNPIDWCKNSILIPKNSPDFGEWVDKGFRRALQNPECRAMEVAALNHYEGLVQRHA